MHAPLWYIFCTFSSRAPTAFQINYWPLLSHHKQALYKISIALCPHWLKLESYWPHVVLTSPMHQEHSAFLLNYPLLRGAITTQWAHTMDFCFITLTNSRVGINKLIYHPPDWGFPAGAVRTWIMLYILMYVYCSIKVFFSSFSLCQPCCYQFNVSDSDR